jgi:cell division protein FtsX
MHGFEAFGILGLVMGLGFGLLGLACFAVWIWALIDILKNEFTCNNKLIWLVLVVILPVLGVVLYYFIGREQKIAATGAVAGRKTDPETDQGGKS